jgi:hypothetical protein
MEVGAVYPFARGDTAGIPFVAWANKKHTVPYDLTGKGLTFSLAAVQAGPVLVQKKSTGDGGDDSQILVTS